MKNKIYNKIRVLKFGIRKNKLRYLKYLDKNPLVIGIQLLLFYIYCFIFPQFINIHNKKLLFTLGFFLGFISISTLFLFVWYQDHKMDRTRKKALITLEKFRKNLWK